MKTKTIITLVLAFLFVSCLQAQGDDEEMKMLFHKKEKDGNGKMANGGYGAFYVGWTQINGKGSVLLGGRGAWIANHRFGLGLAGAGFFNDFYNGSSNNPEDFILLGGYGGLLVEAIILPNSPVHISVPIVLGAGGVTAAPPGNWDYYDNNGGYYNNYYYDTDAYFVFEPGVDIEFNIVKFFRVALTGSYRFTDGINLQYKYLDNNNLEQVVTIDRKALDAFNLALTFKFGWF